jgi:peptidoglycan/LPS O-acetylase OafA/YrhL
MLAKMVVNYGLNHGWPLMPELLGYITLPDWVWKVPTLAHLVAPIAGFNNLKAILVFSLVVLVLLTGLYSTLYAIIYRIFGPPRYSAVDAPPQKRKPKRYIR